MMNHKGLLASLALVFGLALGLLGSQVLAQADADEEPIAREELQKRPLETMDGKQVRMIRVELAPGAAFDDEPTAVYPAEELVYVAEGSGVLLREDEEVEIEAGDSFYNAFEQPHSVMNTSDSEPLTIVAVWFGDEDDF